MVSHWWTADLCVALHTAGTIISWCPTGGQPTSVWLYTRPGPSSHGVPLVDSRPLCGSTHGRDHHLMVSHWWAADLCVALHMAGTIISWCPTGGQPTSVWLYTRPGPSSHGVPLVDSRPLCGSTHGRDRHLMVSHWWTADLCVALHTAGTIISWCPTGGQPTSVWLYTWPGPSSHGVPLVDSRPLCGSTHGRDHHLLVSHWWTADLCVALHTAGTIISWCPTGGQPTSVWLYTRPGPSSHGVPLVDSRPENMAYREQTTEVNSWV